MINILAYIDPGSGSLIFQMLIASLMGMMFLFRKFFTAPLNFIASIFRKRKQEENDS
ncbi:MAG TPA: hypothetical protein VIH61_08435 [Waddliaceae bacterium]|jgi:hypothetical protein